MRTTKPSGASPAALSATEFFARRLPGCSMSDAHLATRISYSTIHDVAHGRCEPRRKTLQLLEEWSRGAAAEHGVFISGALSLGFAEVQATGTDG